MTIEQTISVVPTPPISTNPSDFDSKADAFLDALPNLGTELNLYKDQVNSTAASINEDKLAAQEAKDGAESARNQTETIRESAASYANQIMQNKAFTATSNSSVEIETGSKVFILNEINRAFTSGTSLKIVSNADPENSHMAGIVSAYIDNTLTVSVSAVMGSGTFDDWHIGFAVGGDAETVNGKTAIEHLKKHFLL